MIDAHHNDITSRYEFSRTVTLMERTLVRRCHSAHCTTFPVPSKYRHSITGTVKGRTKQMNAFMKTGFHPESQGGLSKLEGS